MDRIDYDARAYERNERALDRRGRSGYRNTVFSDVTNRALDGESLRFNTVFDYKGDDVLFKSGSFGSVAAKTVAFCTDHVLSSAAANTDNGSLELFVDDDAIRFRVHLSKAKHGSVLARMCEIGARDATSIGCDIIDETKETIEGKRVRVIHRARLTEISLCSIGRVPTAFAMLVDTTVTPKPTSGSETATFTAGRALHKINRQIKAMKQGLVAVHAALTPRPKFAMTVSQSNRLHTEEMEALQQRVRGTHSLYI